MKKINALIPARGGSKGVLKKNIKNLGGHPLIAYSIAACKESKYVENIYISTDDEEIAKIAKEYGAQVPFMRPEKYSQDHSTDNDVLKHYFEHISGDEIAFIRPTTPLRNPEYIDKCIKEYYTKNKELCSSVRSVHILPECPYKMYKLSEDGYCEGFFQDFKGRKNYSNLPRQMFPVAYHPNGYIDIIKKSEAQTSNTFGDRVLPFITDFSIEVDTQEQFDLLELKVEKEGSELLRAIKNGKNKK